MNSSDRSHLTVETLLALRSEPDALRIISERLQLKRMGPADHIRTKHELKSFLESGDKESAKALLERSSHRHAVNCVVVQKASIARSQRL